MAGVINKLKCRIFGHKRGKRFQGTEVISYPRCKSTWTRKIKAVAA